MADTTAIGNAGEHLVMANLLEMGFQAFMADRGNTAFDISCVDGPRHTLLRVKTTTADMVKWTAKKNDSIFIDLRENNDFVALVDLRLGIQGAQIYILPSGLVSNTLQELHPFYISHPRQDGGVRKDTKLRGVYLSGSPRPTNRSYGFQDAWAKYLNGWEQLRATSSNST